MKRVLAGLIVFTMSIGAPMASADELTEADVKRLALEAILENPEIVMQAVNIPQRREEKAKAEAAGQILTDQRELLEQDANAPVIGNRYGDVTLDSLLYALAGIRFSFDAAHQLTFFSQTGLHTRHDRPTCAGWSGSFSQCCE